MLLTPDGQMLVPANGLLVPSDGVYARAIPQSLWLFDGGSGRKRAINASSKSTFNRGPLAGAIVESLFKDVAVGVALLDEKGVVSRANTRFSMLTGAEELAPVWPFLPAKADLLKGALEAARPQDVTVSIVVSGVRQVLAFMLLPMPSRGGLLRVVDQTYEQDREDQLGQTSRFQTVGELAGGIAHDVNNLLTVILGASEEGDFALISNTARRSAALVHRLLPAPQMKHMETQTVALNHAITAARSLLARLLGPAIALDICLENPDGCIPLDSSQLDQVLINLVSNAAHAMPRGGRLIITTRQNESLPAHVVGRQFVPAGHYTRLTVCDNGEGMSAEVMCQIFEPFFSTRRKSGGTGLGLATVKEIVSQVGGYIDVQSQVGCGTRFSILLPRHEQSAYRDDMDRSSWRLSSVKTQSSRALLLVDDEDCIRAVSERILLKAGWRVVSASSAEEAMELVRDENLIRTLGGVISDVVMSDRDGLVLVRQLREFRPELPALLMSGGGNSGFRRTLEQENIGFLQKPFASLEMASAAERQFREKIIYPGTLTERRLLQKNLMEGRHVSGAPLGAIGSTAVSAAEIQ